jgi:hypothetical protein
MTNETRITELEDVLAQFLKPIRNLPFPVVIKALSGAVVIPVDQKKAEDIALIAALSKAAQLVGMKVRSRPIRRVRKNEVGNDIERYVMEAIQECGLYAEGPRSVGGKSQSSGYPDLLVSGTDNRPTYLECKTFGENNDQSTFRSFFVSPSKNFKAHLDARHLLLAFGIVEDPINDSDHSFYRAVSFKLVDLHGLKCDVKYEFNSDNRRLYAPDILLAQGDV